MNGMALKKLRKVGYLVGLIAGAHVLLGATCGPITPVVDIGPDGYFCECECPGSGHPPEFLPVCASESNVMQACQSACSWTCNVNSISSSDAVSCGSGTTSEAQSAEVPNSNDVSTDPGESRAVVTYFGDEADVNVAGEVKFTGGCSAGRCPISLDYISFQPDDFTIMGSNNVEIQVTNISVRNLVPMVGEQDDGYFTIPSSEMLVRVTALVDGAPQSVVLSPEQDLDGFYDAASGRFDLYAHFFSGTTLDLTMDLHGEATARPPVADAGAPQVVDGSPDTATVTLDGSASSDPDDDLVEIRWFEGSNYLGSGATISATFDRGAHTVTAIAVDATAKWSTAETTVTVVPR